MEAKTTVEGNNITNDSTNKSTPVGNEQKMPQEEMDSASRFMRLYDFEYGVIPYLAELCSKRQLHPFQIADKEFIMNAVKNNCEVIEWNWDEFKSTIQQEGNSVLILYWFPEPQFSPLARFGVDVITKDGLNYYTLEFDDHFNRIKWYLCHPTVKGHSLITEVEECKTMEEFISLLRRHRLLKPLKTRSIGSYIKGLFKKHND